MNYVQALAWLILSRFRSRMMLTHAPDAFAAEMAPSVRSWTERGDSIFGQNRLHPAPRCQS